MTVTGRFHHSILDRRVPISGAATPVREASALRRGLSIKDEGAIHGAYGGNKVRKLEFLLHGAGERVVTMGAAGSHHVLATAVHASRIGHRVEAMAFPRPETSHARDVLRAATARATIHVAGDHERAMQGFERLAAGATSFPAGGSSAVGTLGWVLAGLELAEQVARGELPEPHRVFCPLGTAGTVLGAAIGLRLAGLRSRVVAVRVVPAEWLTREKIAALADEVLGLLELRGVSAHDLAIEFDDAQLGPGYGEPTAEGIDAIARGAEAGLHLEPTYTGKTLSAALAADSGAGPDLYWQTHSTVPLEPLLAEAAPLSAELEAMLVPIEAERVATESAR
jgi:D-cysteine desulfhydrase